MIQQRAKRLCLIYIFYLYLTSVTITQDVNIVEYQETATMPNRQQTSDVLKLAAAYVTWDDVLSRESNVTLKTYLHTIQTNNVYELSNSICDYLANLKIGASVGLSSPATREYMHVLSSRVKVPYLELMPMSDYSREQIICMHPKPADLCNLTVLLADRWDWKNINVLFEKDSGSHSHIDLLTALASDDRTVTSHQLEIDGDYTEALNHLRRANVSRVIVDCGFHQVKGFLNRALEMQMLTSEYHYHFTSMDLHVLDLSHYSYGGAKITWAQMVKKISNYEKDMSKQVKAFKIFLEQSGLLTNDDPQIFTTHNALLVDSIILLAKGINMATNYSKRFTTDSIDCNSTLDWNGGFGLWNNMITEKFEGMTGSVRFDRYGQRQNYTLMLMELDNSGIINQFGTYNPQSGILIWPDPPAPKVDIKEDDYMNRVLRVTTIALEPFFSNVTLSSGEPLTGNDRFTGFCVELMEYIAKHTGIKYEFHLVADGEYGIDDNNGTWNGMVGEILDGKADMAVAPLTINFKREQYIDFTKPFMTFGISILYKTPKVESPHMMSFSEPITYEVWGTIVASLVAVSLSMYVCARFSPTEWENPFPCKDDYEYMRNQFSVTNVFWFAIGSIMQQGCDIMPKGPSTRLVAIAWWFFTLIIISSYTANLAAFLTITTMSETFKNAQELADQTDIKFGCQLNGSTCSFFQHSNISTYKQMWNFIEETDDAMVLQQADGVRRVKEGKYAFLMESSTLQYIIATDEQCELQQVGPPLNSLSYGIGLKTGSPLTDILSSTILLLNEDQVLLELYNKYWHVEDNSCALKQADKTSNPTLEVENLAGVFVFLLSGLAFALVMLCAEILVFTARRSHIEKVSCFKILGIWLKNSIKGKFPNSRSLTSLESLDIHSNNNANACKKRTNSFVDELIPITNGHSEHVRVNDLHETII